jgi:hypothetical protein
VDNVDEAIAAEADAFASFCLEGDVTRFRRVRVAEGDGVAVVSYRADSPSGGDATTLAVLLDQDRRGRRTALDAHELRVGGTRAISMKPPQRGDWIVVSTARPRRE